MDETSRPQASSCSIFTCQTPVSSIPSKGRPLLPGTDGWDKHDSLWQFNGGFPGGFTPIREAAEKYSTEPGVWMSPWGGYSKAKQERIAYGKGAGFEIVDNGFALSGTKHYDRFRDVCLEMIKKSLFQFVRRST